MFGRLREGLEREALQLTGEPEAAAPEYVLVLELAGEMDEFITAVAKVDGLEYLAEELGEKLDDTTVFAAVDNRTNSRTSLRRELFVVASDERAARELERLWALWRSGQPLPRGWATWRTVFERLITVRQWDDRDRLERTGAAEVWLAELGGAGQELIPFEIELWFRTNADRRVVERDRLAGYLQAYGGRVLREFVLAEIAYYGMLAELPASTLLETAQSMSVAWASGRGIRFLRAAGQAGVPLTETADTRPGPSPPRFAGVARAPRLALLDGLPLAGHALLQGRIVVDDPDGWEEIIAVRHRQHGTAMASAILHGDLGTAEEPLDETLYVRPIIRVDPRYDWVHDPEENIPVERLPVELVHDAVVRVKQGEDAVAPGVRIINLSVGDRAQQLDRFVSPWARLLDYLAAAYDVLFIVSAGNHYLTLSLPQDVDISDPAEVESETLAHLVRTAGLRRLLAPAESVNALTVGGSQIDAGDLPNDGRINPITTPGVGLHTAVGVPGTGG